MAGLGSLGGLGSGMSLGQLPGAGSGAGGGLGDLLGSGGDSGTGASAGASLGNVGGSSLGSLGGDASGSGPAAIDPAGSGSQSFASVLKDIVISNPSAAQNSADSLAALSAAGGDVDPGTLAVQSAKASIEVQMSTSTISSAVSGVRTLMQMQV